MAGSSILGVKELLAALDGVVAGAQETTKQIVKRSEVVVQGGIQKQFTGAHQRGTPTTSAPGSPPDVVSGALRRSVRMSPVTVSGLTASGSVYPSMVYARIQELGGTAGNGAVLMPRPYVRPAYDAALPRLQAIAVEEWSRILPR